MKVTFVVTKLDKSKYSKALQFLNIPIIFSTFFVSKEDTSKLISDEQS